MRETPSLHQGFLSRVHGSTAIVPPRRYSIKRLTELCRQCSGALDLEKISHAALQAGVLKREVMLPYITMVDGPLSEVPINFRRGLTTVATRGRRPTEDWALLPDNNNVQFGETESVAADSGLTKQDEGFAKFLKTHSSPTHQRVTAGGRIVPMEATPPPPFKGFSKGVTYTDTMKPQAKPLPGQRPIEYSRQQVLQSSTGGANELPSAINLSSHDHNHHFSSPLIAPNPIAASSFNQTPWWGPVNQQRPGAISALPSSLPLNGYPVPTYSSTTSQSSPAAGLVDVGNRSAVLDIPQGSSHNSNAIFQSPLVVSQLPAPAQPVQANGSGVMFGPFSPPAGVAYPFYQAPPARDSMPGTQASYGFMAPAGKPTVVANPSMSMDLNVNGPIPNSFSTTVDRARQQYKAVTERIEQFNKEVVLQNPALDNVQQSAIAKYRLDMATERARAHKVLKTLEAAAKPSNSHASETSTDENKAENGAGSKVQSCLPMNSPSRGLNVEAPIWQPRKSFNGSTPSTYSPSENTVTDPNIEEEAPYQVQEREPLLPIQRPGSAKRSMTSAKIMKPIDRNIPLTNNDSNGRQLPRVAGVGPLGSASYPIPELLALDGSDDKKPHKLLMWTDDSGRRTDQIPPHIISYYRKKTDEIVRAMAVGEEPNFDKFEKPLDYDYFMNWEPINKDQWKIMSGHFGVRKALREEFAYETQDKGKRGPEGSETHEWDRRFDAARHHRGVETIVWTKKHGWITCQGLDLQPPGRDDDRWMTDYERRYWIRKPDSIFHKLRPGEPRIEDMENTCDECSQLSIDDDATVYTEDPKWLDLLAQYERLIAAGEAVDIPRRVPPEEPYIRSGKQLSMEETKALWREEVEARKKHRNEHKVHKSRRCPKHAKVKAAKEEQVRSWLNNTVRPSPSKGLPLPYLDMEIGHKHSTAAIKFPSSSRRQARFAEDIRRGIDPWLRPSSHENSNYSGSFSEPRKQGWGHEVRTGGLGSFMPNSSGYSPSKTRRLADHSNDPPVSPRPSSVFHHSEAQRHKGVSSVSVSPNLANATTCMTAQRKFDNRSDLIQLLKNISPPKENETNPTPADEPPVNTIMDTRPRFPFQGNFSREL